MPKSGKRGLSPRGALFFVPLLFFRPLSDAFHLPKYVLVCAIVSFLLLERVKKWRENGRIEIPRSPFLIPLLAILFWQMLSLLSAVNVSAGILVSLRFLLFTVLFLLLSMDGGFRAMPERTLDLMVYSGSVVALYGTCQHFGLDFFRWTFEGSPLSTLGRRNFAAEFLVSVIPWSVLAVCVSRGRRKVFFHGMGLVLLVVHLFLTYTRASWLGLAACLPFLWFLVAERITGGLRKGTVSAFVALCVICAAGTLSAQDTGFTAGSVAARIRIWKAAAQMVRRNPVLGVGAGNFPLVYPFHAVGIPDAELPSGSRVENAHNDYLEIAAENGIPGLAAFLLLIVLISRTEARLLRNADSRERVILLAASGSCAAVLANAVAAFPFRNPSVLLVFFLNLSVLQVLYEKRMESPRFSAELNPRRSSVLLSCSYAAVSAVAILCICAVLHGWFLKQALGTKDPRTAIRKVSVSLACNPWSVVPHFLAGKTYLALGQPDIACRHFRYAQRLDPGLDTVYLNLGVCRHRMGDAAEAEKNYRLALMLQPGRQEAHNNLGCLYLERGRNDLAVREFEKVLEIRPDSADAAYNLGVLHVRAKEGAKALFWFRRALEIDPGYAKAREELSRLEQDAGREK